LGVGFEKPPTLVLSVSQNRRFACFQFLKTDDLRVFSFSKPTICVFSVSQN